MNRWSEVLLSFICIFALAACGKSPSTASDGVPQTQPLAPASANAGGYEPTADERVPGITMSQQELDRIYAEARRNMPVPVIPVAGDSAEQ